LITDMSHCGSIRVLKRNKTFGAGTVGGLGGFGKEGETVKGGNALKGSSNAGPHNIWIYRGLQKSIEESERGGTAMNDHRQEMIRDGATVDWLAWFGTRR